ncbi:MAG: 1,4-dihydroxy-2-naphthoate octaprenyltransferase [Candidatus Neomarinimicrobiota bacterium]
MKIWIKAFRLRTLPLALACIIMGNGLAYGAGRFSWFIFSLTLITTLFLQILSNLANDFGDYSHGVDNQSRIGPERTMQAGLISRSKMISAMIVISLLCSISGVGLILAATGPWAWGEKIIFSLLGLSAMAAALKYTMGKNPYGYAGYGDFAVFLFFGWLGVLGSYFLQVHSINGLLFLPASALGMFTAAVLNINNMRDHKADKKQGKRTLVVQMGFRAARRYHLFLNFTPLLLCFLFSLYYHPQPKLMNFLYLITLPIFLRNSLEILRQDDFEAFDPFLKKQAVLTFVFSIIFAISLNF